MPTTNCIRRIGPTTVLSVSNSSHAAVTIAPSANEEMAFASFLNTGSTTVAVTVINSNAGTAGASTIPADGSSGDVHILPPSMQQPMILAVPGPSFSMTAIGSAAGPSTIYVAPVSVQ